MHGTSDGPSEQAIEFKGWNSVAETNWLIERLRTMLAW